MIITGDSLQIVPKLIADGYLFDHIITDPVYDNQPPISLLRSWCPTGNILVFCSPLQRPDTPPDEILFWIKTPSTKNTVKRCSCFVEEICVYRGKNAAFNHLHWSVMTGVFTDTIIVKNSHPWQKPTSLMEKLVMIYSNPGRTILDPYAGSGTTITAADRCGRVGIGIEIK
jgi:DNA modification methylase